MDVQAFIVLLRLTHMHTQTRTHAMAIIHYFYVAGTVYRFA